MRRPAQGRGTAQRTRRPRKAVLSGAVLLCGAPPGAAARPKMCSALCGKGRGCFWLTANGRFLRRWPCQSRGGAFALVHGPVFCYNKISTGPRAAQAPPFSRKVVISRKIENSRQTDGNPDNLLKFLISPAVNSSQVFSLGFVMGGRSFLLIGKRKEQPFSD